MIVEVYFRITFTGITKKEMDSKLRKIQLITYSLRDIKDRDSDPNTIECIAIVPEENDLAMAVARMNALYLINGVQRISIDHVAPKKEKKDWFKHPILPILISAVLSFLNVYVILTGLNVKLNTFNDYATAFFIPTITFVASAILYRFY